MIITNADLRPSIRFIEVIKEYFLANGYTFKKSAKTFVKDFEGGKQDVLLSFLNLSGGTEAELIFGITFPELEKLYAEVKGLNKRKDTGSSLGLELNHLPEIRYSEQLYSFPLYDNYTFKVDDFSINRAAEGFIKAFEKFVIPFFEHYKFLHNVEKQLNRLPIEHPVITNWKDKHILFGLVLASYYSKENYNEILNSYKNYIETMIVPVKISLNDFLNETKKLITNINVAALWK